MREASVLQIALDNPDWDDPETGVAENRDNMCALLERAAEFDPDFISFPELALVNGARGDDVPYETVAEPVPGPTTEAIGERAQSLDSYVLVPMYERNGDDVYNAVAFVGPDGDVRGTYRKIATTASSMEKGLSPGSEVPVWETEFGTVGALICWDARYPELAAVLGAKGANLVFHPTLGSGHRQFGTWATYQGFHFAFTGKRGARLYTPKGNVTAEVKSAWKNPGVSDLDLSGASAKFLYTPVNTDCKSYSRGGAGHDALERIQRRYPDEIVIHADNDEATFVLESVSEDVTLADLEREFQLPTPREYEDRVRRMVLERSDGAPLLDMDEIVRE